MSLSERPLLSIIIVNYRSSGILGNCLDSVGRSRLSASYETIVVDNGTWDEGMDRLEHEWPQVKFVRLPENLGFAGGNNAGFRVASGKYYLLLNPDAEVAPDAVQKLIDTAAADPKIGMAGPKIFYPDGSLQMRYLPKRMPTLASFFFELFYLDKLFAKHPVINGYYGGDFDVDREQDLGQLCGACLLIKREVIDRIGGIDEKLFLYFDEADWCRRAAAAGYRVRYIPSASIIHHEAQSAGLDKRRSIALWHNSQLYLMQKHYGRPTASALFVLNLIGYIFRLLAAPYHLVRHRNLDKIKKNIYQLEYHLRLSRLWKIMVS